MGRSGHSAAHPSGRQRLSSRLGTDRVFYGWYMVTAGSVSNFFIIGVAIYGLGALYEPMRRDLGWSMAALTAGASVRSFEHGFMAPITGYLMDRFGPRRMALSGIALLTAGLFMLSQVHSLWFYYTAAATIALGSSLCAIVPFTVAIMSWFDEHRGRAMGLLNTGNGLAYITVSIIALLVASFGWRQAVILCAVVVFVVALPLAMTLRASPEPFGYYPDGKAPGPNEDGTQPGLTVGERTGLTVKEAARTPTFYLLSLSHAVNSVGTSTWIVLQVPHLLNVGYSVAATGSIVGAYGIVQVVLRVVSGWMGDKIGRRSMFIFGFLFQGAGLAVFALLSPERWWLLPAYYLTFGVGHATSIVVGQTMTADYFGTKRFATIRGLNQTLSMPAGLVAPVLAGLIFDRTGDYSHMFLIYAGIVTTGAIWVSLIRRPRWRDLLTSHSGPALAGHE